MRKIMWRACVAGLCSTCLVAGPAAWAQDEGKEVAAAAGDGAGEQSPAATTPDPRVRYGHRNYFMENSNLAQIDVNTWKASKVHFYVSLDETYDDNIGNTAENEEDDWITTVTAGITFVYPEASARPMRISLDNAAPGLLTTAPVIDERGGHSQVMLSYDTQYKHYADHSDDPQYDEGLDHKVQAMARYGFSRGGGITLIGAYVDSYDPVQTTDSGQSDEFNTYLATAKVDIPLGHRLSMDFGYSWAQVDYRDSYADFKDRTDDTYFAGFGYKYSQKLDFRLNYRYNAVDYDTTAENSKDVQTVSLGVNWRPTRKTSLGAEAGVQTRDYDMGDPFDSDDTAFTFNVNAALRLTPRSMLSFTAGKAMYEPRVEDAAASDNWNAGLTYRLALTERLSASLALDYSSNDYEYFSAEENRTDEFYGISPALMYRFRRWLHAGLSYRYTKRDSDLDMYDYSKNEYWLQLQASF